MNILVLVVIYKKSMKDSQTLHSLMSCRLDENDTILVWDNSPDAQLTPADVSKLETVAGQVKCIHSSENLPLSALYNKVFQEYLPGHDFICLLDHDSRFDADLFKEWRSVSLSNSSLHLFLPIVRSGTTIVSPASLYAFKGFYWKQPKYGIIASKNVAAINSGMIISSVYLAKEFKGYDTRLRFYGTDTYFMQQYWKTTHPVYVMKSELKHSLDFFESNNVEDKIRRFREMRRATYILGGTNVFSRIATGSYLVLLSLYYSAKYSNFGFLR